MLAPWPPGDLLADPFVGATLLVLAGVVGGLLNTLAGGGSFVILPLLIGLGLSPGVANATSRIGVLANGSAAALTFARDRALHTGLVARMAGPMCAGALLGAWLATRTSDAVLRPVIGGVLIAWALVLVFRPGRMLTPPPEPRPPGVPAFVFATLIGVYGGFLQAGVGFPLIALFVSHLGHDLLRANAAKVALVFVYTSLVVAVFAAAGQIDWPRAGLLAIGMTFGGWLGARLQIRAGAPLVRWAIVVMVGVSGAALLL
ncbi:sulfite exporter TauE/SafE family protein [Nannocystis radixulma]|uniref:Probable membrane transporter protein n=1 Tax=Nannocystis radixulma TaxID=2995305 RepID=A0ABT5AZC5_9BACT|nr:sulfite exporter TauE/SafE family protein [Nannocystis radixulma]MCY1054240.1 sulfite exporter TauE/SafE family protein [Nannocystis sp. SCPEA4]MDC0666858.1 sulfite exporter TauE/SafE family protein [Nannocystis radixulma]